MKATIQHILTLLLLLPLCYAQAQTAAVKGKVVNEANEPLSQVSITILGQQKSFISNDSGYFYIKAPAHKPFALVFSYTGYVNAQHNFLLASAEEKYVSIKLEKSTNLLNEVVVTDARERYEAGVIRINPKLAANMPSAISGIESFLKVFVGSNNELTSGYNVRGGNYDENLIYVNDFEIFRPYLVRNGQQEGLSFINPQLVRNINFYTGGFQARYGDKMSSVLDIQYNKPQKSGGSAYAGMLEQGAHIEGAHKKNKLTYVMGARNRYNQNLLSRQQTQGSYLPSSADLQALIGWQASARWQVEVLSNVSSSKFSLLPRSSQLTTSVFSPYFTQNVAVDIAFEGREKDAYTTAMFGASATYQPNKKIKLKWLASRFENNETENIDITGSYLFGQRDTDNEEATYGQITNPLGKGTYQTYARNRLQITNYNLSHKGNLTAKGHFIQWGAGVDRTSIKDRLNEWQATDSAGYTQPYNSNYLQLKDVIFSQADFDVYKLTAYVQDNMVFNQLAHTFTLQPGIRFNYNSLNGEALISPRVNASWKPGWQRDVVFRAAAGAYHQPPFYREMRQYNGELNTALKAQKSWQTVLGADYNFIGWNRLLRLTTEAYYKYMTDVVPYDIDNVRVRYTGTNSAKAYATGIEMRLYGEVVKDAESWVSFGLMRTRENLLNDFYTSYKTDSLNNITDSSIIEGGWLRRPTDRLLTFGMFFQDYLSTNKNTKVYLSALYGSNLPYNIPGSVQYRNALTIPAYIRLDVGFSAMLLKADKSNRKSLSPFRNFENIWANLEVFNLIDKQNTISYLLIKDVANNTFSLPNKLTPRMLNIKLVARW